jgi:pimeloyl-ACP methyl ester carboxylesterase
MRFCTGFKWLAIITLLNGGILAANALPRSPGFSDFRDEPLQIPITAPTGHIQMMSGHICFPDSPLRPHLVVINHGSPPSSADRPNMKLAGCRSEAVGWFLHRHYAVALVARLGYGSTGGPWTEGYNQCENADFYQAGIETARQIKTTVDFLETRHDLQPDGVIVVGQSAGGWGSLAYDSIAHSHVSEFINMAGGRGGHYQERAGNNCHPERLVEAAARFGKTASTPVLWIVAQNDSFFSPSLAQEMNHAFVQAGGKTKYIEVGAFGKDGHHLFFGKGGSDVWGPLVEKFTVPTP